MKEYAENIGREAKETSYKLSKLTANEKNAVLLYAAEIMDSEKSKVFEANALDIEEAKKSGMGKAMLDRLTITESRFNDMKKALRDIAALNDVVGEYTEIKKRGDGLLIGRMRAPLGVVFMIYEARPNVTIDAAALCFKSGNACILRGGSDAIHSNAALYKVLQKALKHYAIPQGAISFVEKTDRAIVNEFLTMEQYIDLIIPRGGESLVKFVVKESNIPVIRHDKGLCHTYIEKDYDKNEAIKIVVNAKTQRVSVCNATESLLIHKDFPYAKEVLGALFHQNVVIRGCSKTEALDERVIPAKAEDWDTEYNDYIISVRIVENFEQAVSHINRHGSHHTDAILTNDMHLAERFKTEVDSACVFINTSTRLSDGAEFGLGAEIGISNQKLHHRGPMALEGLTSLKYVVVGNGHIKQ